MGEIYVEGFASRRVACDIMRIEIMFSHSGSQMYNLRPMVQNDCDVFLEAMKKHGFPPQAFQLLQDESSENYHDHKTEVTRKIVFTSALNLSLQDLILNILVENHLNADYDVYYKYSALAKLHEELTQEAFRDSERKAKQIAQSMGMQNIRLGKVKLNPGMKEDWDFTKEDDMQGIHCLTGSVEAADYLSNSMRSADTTETERISAVWIVE